MNLHVRILAKNRMPVGQRKLYFICAFMVGGYNSRFNEFVVR